jgi:hypothetical protein
MLVFIKRVISKRFEWCWKREKSFMQKVVQTGACLDCGFVTTQIFGEIEINGIHSNTKFWSQQIFLFLNTRLVSCL